MLTRRQSLLALLSLSVVPPVSIAPPALAAADSRPDKLIAGLYERIRRNPNVPMPGFGYRKSDHRLLSSSLRELWAKTDARAKELDDEIGPLGFDVVTDGQDGEVKSYKLTIIEGDGRRATVRARFDRGPTFDKRIGVVEYQLVNEGGWKIDDIRGTTDDRPWRLREILSGYLKNPGFEPKPKH
jgi:hypothetical protein